jgi:hypothetical protein
MKMSQENEVQRLKKELLESDGRIVELHYALSEIKKQFDTEYTEAEIFDDAFNNYIYQTILKAFKTS